MSKDAKEFESAFGSILEGMRETYEKEGLVLVRGLMEDDSLDRLSEGGQKLAEAVMAGWSTFTSLKFGSIFLYPNEDEKAAASGEAFREAALTSTIPAFIAKVLFHMDENNENETTLRLLKDAFMAKGKEQSHCGWHVDDGGFWPTSSASNGVNVWVALDDMPAKYGGGLAVSPKSHTADWRQAAYEAIGSTKIFPPEGIGIDSHLFMQVFGKTCGMRDLDPALNERIESSKVEFDYQKGDCLFCTRWLFHRSVQVNDEGLKHYDDATALKRYTIRYERGTARVIKGLCVEPCVLVDSDNCGKTLDEVCENGNPYYPQCWPPLSDGSQQGTQMQTLAKDIFPGTEAKRGQVMKQVSEMMSKAKASKGY